MGRITVAVIVSLWVIPVSLLVNHIVPQPYMDEIFHVPQAQQYCKANFTSWDPMITTPPGLYLASLAHVASLFPGMFCVKAASSFSDACSTSILRSVNGMLAVICSVLIYEIITRLRPTLEDRKVTLSAVVLSLYPLHWFFTYLFYTDVASLTAVLASYLMVLKQRYWISALLGAFAVFVRQTNIIWTLFVACIGVINLTLAQQKDKRQIDSRSEAKATQYASRTSFTTSNLRMRRPRMHEDASNNIVSQATIHSLPRSEGLFEEILNLLSTSWQLKWKLLSSFSLFILNMVAFIAFVYWNGSIVLGAKDAHTMSPHFAQLLYFSLVSACFMAPALISLHQIVALAPRAFMKKKLVNIFNLAIALTAGFLSMHLFSIAHPYLVADNRHYTFYFWRKVIKSHSMTKYILVPVSVCSWFCICSVLAKTQKKIWVVSFFLACVATLVPAPLIEFRYYTIPFFFIILHVEVDNEISWILMGALYIAVNLFTMFMFLFRPFAWDHEDGVQRFIW